MHLQIANADRIKTGNFSINSIPNNRNIPAKRNIPAICKYSS